jgi:hypothetical protein
VKEFVETGIDEHQSGEQAEDEEDFVFHKSCFCIETIWLQIYVQLIGFAKYFLSRLRKVAANPHQHWLNEYEKG